MIRACSTIRAKRNAYRILVGDPDGLRPLGKPRRRWLYITMGLREIGLCGMEWIYLAQDGDQWRAIVNTVMNLQVPLNAWKFLGSCTTGGFSRRAQLHSPQTFVCAMRYLLLRNPRFAAAWRKRVSVGK
jgi:hypothetical protein